MFKAIYNNLPWKKTRKPFKKISLGICAMDKKAKSKPMREILQRLPPELFEIVMFGDDLLVNQPIESWPSAEILIAFYSTGYPTEKVLEYIKLRNPFLINDLEIDSVMKDRRQVYEMLESQGIDVPKHVFVNRDTPGTENVIEEFDEYIVFNGVELRKPLVEKPVDAEDHNIYIYYPRSTGGGSKRLFRKVNDRSSEFYPHINELRSEGSYIYEEFVITQGTDVKVYTVGPDYAHAEARKSPVVDGRVKRDTEGREVRYPVILSPAEKLMAVKIVRAFRQTVCGFDILRVQGKSYCCDVNGFSFVKNSRKYYEDASQILSELMLCAVRADFLAKGPPAINPRGPTQQQALQVKAAREGVRHRTTLVEAYPPTTTVTAASVVAAASSGAGTPGTHSRSGSLGGGPTNSPDSPPKGHDVGSCASSSSGTVSSLAANAAIDQFRAEYPASAGAGAGVGLGQGIGMGMGPASGDVDISMHSTDSTFANLRKGAQHAEELVAVIAIVRHADRTPKQKLKIKVTEPRFLDYFHTYTSNPGKEMKVKSRSGLIQFLAVTRQVIADYESTGSNVELARKLRQVRDVLESHEISGINRKLQMKPERWADDEVDEEPDSAAAVVDEPASGTENDQKMTGKEEEGEDKGKDKEKKKKGKDKDNGKSKASSCALATEVLLILKWGGDLTPLGRKQAESLGATFRHNNYPTSDGGGVLRLHATYRHDLKVKASDEGRVMKTAAAFAKGLLDLEGQLTPILTSLVTVEDKGSSGGEQQMLDRGGNFELKEEMEICKRRMDLLQVDHEMDAELINSVAPGCSHAMERSLRSLNNPLQTLRRMHSLIDGVVKHLQRHVEQNELLLQARKAAEESGGFSDEKRGAYVEGASEGGAGDGAAQQPGMRHGSLEMYSHSRRGTVESGSYVPQTPDDDTTPMRTREPSAAVPMLGQHELYLGETFELMLDRWEQINNAFWSKKAGRYDLSKVPDAYDMARYDLLHNAHLQLDGMEELYRLSDAFENCVVPQEYGCDRDEKRYIGSKMCGALLEKIKYDMNVAINGPSKDDANADAMLYRLDSAHAEDLQINSFHRCVRTRLYFTSESHMHTLLNVLRFSAPGSPPVICEEGLHLMDNISQVAYLSHIVLRVFEDRFNPYHFHCELSFSPGATNDPFNPEESSCDVAPTILLDKGIRSGDLLRHLEEAIALSQQPRAVYRSNGPSPNPASSPNRKAGDGITKVKPVDGIAAAVAAAAAVSAAANDAPSVVLESDKEGQQNSVIDSNAVDTAVALP